MCSFCDAAKSYIISFYLDTVYVLLHISDTVYVLLHICVMRECVNYLPTNNYYTLVDTEYYLAFKNVGHVDCSWHRNGTGDPLPMAVQYYSSSHLLKFYSIMLVDKSL